MSGIKRRKVVKMNRLDERVEGQKNKKHKAGSPGLVVMGGDSCSRGCGFESQHWTFFSICYCKNFNVYLKRPQIMPIKKRKTREREREANKRFVKVSVITISHSSSHFADYLTTRNHPPTHTPTHTQTRHSIGSQTLPKQFFLSKKFSSKVRLWHER